MHRIGLFRLSYFNELLRISNHILVIIKKWKIFIISKTFISSRNMYMICIYLIIQFNYYLLTVICFLYYHLNVRFLFRIKYLHNFILLNFTFIYSHLFCFLFHNTFVEWAGNIFTAIHYIALAFSQCLSKCCLQTKSWATPTEFN